MSPNEQHVQGVLFSDAELLLACEGGGLVGFGSLPSPRPTQTLNPLAAIARGAYLLQHTWFLYTKDSLDPLRLAERLRRQFEGKGSVPRRSTYPHMRHVKLVLLLPGVIITVRTCPMFFTEMLRGSRVSGALALQVVVLGFRSASQRTEHCGGRSEGSVGVPFLKLRR